MITEKIQNDLIMNHARGMGWTGWKATGAKEIIVATGFTGGIGTFDGSSATLDKLSPNSLILIPTLSINVYINAPFETLGTLAISSFINFYIVGNTSNIVAQPSDFRWTYLTNNATLSVDATKWYYRLDLQTPCIFKVDTLVQVAFSILTAGGLTMFSGSGTAITINKA